MMLLDDQKRIAYFLRSCIVLVVCLALSYTYTWFISLGFIFGVVGSYSFFQYLKLRSSKNKRGVILDAKYSFS